MIVKFYLWTLFVLSIIGSFSCSQEELDIDKKSVKESSIVVVKNRQNIETRSENDFQSYDLFYNGQKYSNILLNQEQVEICKNAKSIGSPVFMTATGYDRYTLRGDGKSYKKSISGTGSTTSGIPAGTYLVRDIWLHKSVTIPVSLAIVQPNNDYTSFQKMGYNPNALTTPGLTAAFGDGKAHLQTAAILVEYDMLGREVNMTYPVNIGSLEWHFYYMEVTP